MKKILLSVVILSLSLVWSALRGASGSTEQGQTTKLLADFMKDLPQGLTDEIARKNRSYEIKWQTGVGATVETYVTSMLKLKLKEEWENFMTSDFVAQLLREKVEEGRFHSAELTDSLKNSLRDGRDLMVEILLKTGACVVSIFKDAISDNNIYMARLLVNSGANVNAKDKQGKTALDYAIEANNSEMEKLLRQYGARQ